MGKAATRMRQNRTITVDFRDEATYFRVLNDGKAFVECALAYWSAQAIREQYLKHPGPLVQ